MIKAFISDLSGVLLSIKDKSYTGKLNALHEDLIAKGDYDFWLFFVLNEELISFYKSINKDINCYLLTRKYIQDYPPLAEKLKGVFKETFIGDRLGYKKDDPRAYQVIIEKINVSAEEILYLDDNRDNLEVAQKVGIKTIQYKFNTQAIEEITKTIT
ncbi:MAG: HAD-IA family hydrolase [Patescibacteria group bacterium]